MRLAGASSTAPEWPSRKPFGGELFQKRSLFGNDKVAPVSQPDLSTDSDHDVDMSDVGPNMLIASSSPQHANARTAKHVQELSATRRTIWKGTNPLSLLAFSSKPRGPHSLGILGSLNLKPRLFIAHTISQDTTGDRKSKILARLVGKRVEHKQKFAKHKLRAGQWTFRNHEDVDNLRAEVLSATDLDVNVDDRNAAPLTGVDSLTEEQVSEFKEAFSLFV